MNIINRFSGVIIGILLCLNVNAQSWPGYETGRFTGISSANLRPGGMAPMPYKVDATLAGFHVNADPKKLFSRDILHVILTGGFHHLGGFGKISSNKMHVFSNLQGPSVMIQASPKIALAFSWNIRYIWLSRFSDPQITQLFNADIPAPNLTITNGSANMLFTGWNEFGLGAGGVLFEEGFHTISAGGFAKLAFGTNHMAINMENINSLTSGNTLNSMSFSMESEISDNTFKPIDNGKPNLADQVGFAFDLGLEYKFTNPRSCPGGSNYRAKLGIALTDIGRVKYNSITQYHTQPTASASNINLSTFRSSGFVTTTDTIQQVFGITTSATPDYNVLLPMSLKLYGEFNIRRRAIIYGELQMVFAQLTNPDMPMLVRANITPRFEDDRFGVYVPLTFSNYTPANAGLAIRLKPFIIGSENLFTFWAYDNRGKSLDFFVTLKIPILNDDERVDWKTMMSRR